LKNPERIRALQCQRADLLRYFLDGKIHSGRVQLEPAKTGVRQVKTKMIFREPKHRAVLNHGAIIFAETTVERLPNRALRGVSGHNAVDELQCIAAADLIFVERRDIDQAGRVANRVVLVIVHYIVGACHEVAGPGSPVLAC